MSTYLKFSDILGMTLTAIEGNKGDDELHFTTKEGRKFKLWHSQDCCECVRIDQIDGDLNDLIGRPLTMAEEVSNADGPPPENPDSYTWTFYKLATVKGYVTVKWLGESNGYYSEGVDFCEVK